MGSARERNNVRESGSPDAQPIIFAHGYGCDQAMWRFVTPEFEADHRVIVYDHVGFGRSDLAAWDKDKYASLNAYAADLLEVIHELDLHDVIYVGHSVASMIGVLASIAEPERFAKLVLVGPSPRYIDDPDSGYVGGFTREAISDLLNTLDNNHLGWSAAMAPIIMGNQDRPGLSKELETSFCRTNPAVAKSFAAVTFLSDNRADLDRVSVPTLILQCADDAIAPNVVGDFVHDHISGSVLVGLDATGHCPNLSAPDEVSSAIRSYLASS